MKFDPMQIFFYLIRVIPVIVVIILVAYIFFSFKVEVHTEEMGRLNIELAENMLASDLVVTKSVFDAKKLIGLQNMELDEKNRDEKYAIQPKPRVCGYGYSVAVLGGEDKPCDKDDNCKEYCMNMCGMSETEISGHYKCAKGFLGIRKLFGGFECQCECSDDGWQDKYKYQFGYEPGETEINTNQRQYPVGIHEDGFLGFYRSSVSPAIMTVTLYDTWLTRMACMAERAYETQEIQKLHAHKSAKNFGFICLGRSYACLSVKKFDDYLCVFEVDENNFKKEECIYSETPVHTFLSVFNVYKNTNVTVVAYPIKQSLSDTGSPDYKTLYQNTDGNCEKVGNTGFLAKKGDPVSTVIFCLETEKDGGYP